MSQVTLDQPAGDLSAGHKTTSPPTTTGSEHGSWLAWLLHSIPTLLVLALLAGVGYYGHHTGWQLPKFSALAGTAPEERVDWCEEHGVAEAQCVLCKPELLPAPPDHGWCRVHGVANCPLHHPEVAQLSEVPVVSDDDLKVAERALALQDRQPNNSVCNVYQRRIQFASHDALRQAGVEVELVERGPISESISGNGEIRYDPTRLAQLTARMPGSVWQVERNVGDAVREGELLALIDAVEVGQAKSRLMQSLAEAKLQQQNVDRLEGARSAVAGRQILEANAALAKARAVVISAEQSLVNLGLPINADPLLKLSEREVMQQLRLLGIPAEVRAKLDERTITANLLPVISPIDGVIVEREAVAGEVVDSTDTLFQVADTTSMWLVLNISLEHVGQLQLGQTVRFQPAGSEQQITGTLDWISTAADRQTRMVKVRAELPNPQGKLRDETFGTGQIVLREEQRAIVIPSEAVHWEGCCQIVFVRDRGYFDSPESPKVFHVRTVRTGTVKAGTGQAGSTELIAGLLPGEVVATAGSDVLRAQLLKNNLGAGCCEVD
jgi:multidrug efflux pump subunit AcrA (membrane-fusion protein)